MKSLKGENPIHCTEETVGTWKQAAAEGVSAGKQENSLFWHDAEQKPGRTAASPETDVWDCSSQS